MDWPIHDRLDEILRRLKRVEAALDRIAPENKGEVTWCGRPLKELTDDELEEAFRRAMADNPMDPCFLADFHVVNEMTRRGINIRLKVA